MDPIKFTRTDDEGNARTRYAYTNADAVKLRFDGWTEAPAASASAEQRAPVKAAPTAPAKADKPTT